MTHLRRIPILRIQRIEADLRVAFPLLWLPNLIYAARPRVDGCSVLRYDPHRVDNARDVAQKRQKDVYPKMLG